MDHINLAMQTIACSTIPLCIFNPFAVLTAPKDRALLFRAHKLIASECVLSFYWMNVKFFSFQFEYMCFLCPWALLYQFWWHTLCKLCAIPQRDANLLHQRLQLHLSDLHPRPDCYGGSHTQHIANKTCMFKIGKNMDIWQ